VVRRIELFCGSLAHCLKSDRVSQRNESVLLLVGEQLTLVANGGRQTDRHANRIG
jgi:hypothetical protein